MRGNKMYNSGKGRNNSSKIPGNKPNRDKKNMNGYSEAYRKGMSKNTRVNEDAGSGEGY